eukprot:11664862-Ditylum_brightwellii.AAC.1
MAVHPNAAVRFMTSDMILPVHSNVQYLSESNARSQSAGHFYLATKNDKDYNNRAIVTPSIIIQHVVVSASETKLAVLFYNTREAVHLCVLLEVVRHPQPATPSQLTITWRMTSPQEAWSSDIPKLLICTSTG